MKKTDYIRAIVSWAMVSVLYSFGWAMTFIMAPFVALTARKQKTHPFDKPLTSKHRQRYIDEGSSGEWEYVNSNVKLLKWWNNLEDGLYGEPSGKFSASIKGKEKSLYGMIRWTLRNPFNYGKRTLPLFHCDVNNCDISYIGEYRLSDKIPTLGGWNFTKAVDRTTGRHYYYFRWVKHYPNNKVRQFSIGFKIKPEHGDIEQSLDDRDKAFTIRLPFKRSNR